MRGPGVAARGPLERGEAAGAALGGLRRGWVRRGEGAALERGVGVRLHRLGHWALCSNFKRNGWPAVKQGIFSSPLLHTTLRPSFRSRGAEATPSGPLPWRQRTPSFRARYPSTSCLRGRAPSASPSAAATTSGPSRTPASRRCTSSPRLAARRATWPIDADGNPTAPITLQKDSDAWLVSKVQVLDSGAIVYLGPASDSAMTTVGSYEFSFPGQTSAPIAVPRRLLGMGPRAGAPMCSVRLAHVSGDADAYGVVQHAVSSGRPRPLVSASSPDQDEGRVLGAFTPASVHSETLSVPAGRDLDLLLVLNQSQPAARTLLLSLDVRTGR